MNAKKLIEVRVAELLRPQISHVIFDFDGTLSWLRHGWPAIMLDACLRHVPSAFGFDESFRRKLVGDILSLNGKPAVHQIALVCDRVGRQMPAPSLILSEYAASLSDTVRLRMPFVRRNPAEFLIFGARGLLSTLQARGLTLIILSGTAEYEVRQEAELLDIASYFGRHIYGSFADHAFSKSEVIERIMRDESLEGPQILSFGDGPVEISFTKAVGGLAIGVASDEEQNGSRRVDMLKRNHLIAAGADAIIPDYVDADELLRLIFGP